MASLSTGGVIPFKDFQPLSPTISVYRPSNITTRTRSVSSSPALIILTPWLAAQARHVSKYTDAYQSLFPSATILVIRATAADMVYRSYKSQQEDLQIILPLLQTAAGDEGSEIVLHMFSNAGAHKASQLARTYKVQTSKPLKCGMMVFDSSPGIATYTRIVEAMSVGLPAIPVVRQLLAGLVRFLVALICIQNYFSGGANLVQRARMDLNDTKLIKSRRGRLYVYSTADRMVGSEDVESHALEAERSGERVKMERWGGTPHVGHMANDAGRYWGAVESLWNAEFIEQ